jgi:hypothetical protein
MVSDITHMGEGEKRMKVTHVNSLVGWVVIDLVTFEILPMNNLNLDSFQCFFNLRIKKKRVVLNKLKKQFFFFFFFFKKKKKSMHQQTIVSKNFLK